MMRKEEGRKNNRERDRRKRLYYTHKNITIIMMRLSAVLGYAVEESATNILSLLSTKYKLISIFVIRMFVCLTSFFFIILFHNVVLHLFLLHQYQHLNLPILSSHSRFIISIISIHEERIIHLFIYH